MDQDSSHLEPRSMGVPSLSLRWKPFILKCIILIMDGRLEIIDLDATFRPGGREMQKFNLYP